MPILFIVMNRPHYLCPDIFLVLLFVSYTILSYVSFCLEWVKASANQKDDLYFKRDGYNSFTKQAERMYFYAFYQPYLFSVIVLYSDFERQLAERSTICRDWRDLIIRCLRIILWWGLIEFMLHFFYFEAILNDLNFAASLPKNEFVTLGMAMGNFFIFLFYS